MTYRRHLVREIRILVERARRPERREVFARCPIARKDEIGIAQYFAHAIGQRLVAERPEGLRHENDFAPVPLPLRYAASEAPLEFLGAPEISIRKSGQIDDRAEILLARDRQRPLHAARYKLT